MSNEFAPISVGLMGTVSINPARGTKVAVESFTSHSSMSSSTSSSTSSPSSHVLLLFRIELTSFSGEYCTGMTPSGQSKSDKKVCDWKERV